MRSVNKKWCNGLCHSFDFKPICFNWMQIFRTLTSSSLQMKSYEIIMTLNIDTPSTSMKIGHDVNSKSSNQPLSRTTCFRKSAWTLMEGYWSDSWWLLASGVSICSSTYFARYLEAQAHPSFHCQRDAPKHRRSCRKVPCCPPKTSHPRSLNRPWFLFCITFQELPATSYRGSFWDWWFLWIFQNGHCWKGVSFTNLYIMVRANVGRY